MSNQDDVQRLNAENGRLKTENQALQLQVSNLSTQVGAMRNALTQAQQRVGTAKQLHQNASEELSVNHKAAVDRVQQAMGNAAQALASAS